MRFPNDVSLLDEARRKTEKIIDALHEQAPAGYAKPRTYRKRARKEFLLFIRNRKPRETTIRNAIRKQLLYVERNLRIISDYREHVGCDILTRKQYRDLVVISELARQQRELYSRKSHSLAGRIVSIAKPHVRPIARGKAQGMYEFGANRTRENLLYCQEKGIRLSGPKLGRPFLEREKNWERLRQQRRTEREDERTRIAVEGKFEEGKRRYSLDRIGTKLRETSESAIQLVFLVMNLMVVYRKKAKAFFVALMETLFELIRKRFTMQNKQPMAA